METNKSRTRTFLINVAGKKVVVTGVSTIAQAISKAANFVDTAYGMTFGNLKFEVEELDGVVE